VPINEKYEEADRRGWQQGVAFFCKARRFLMLLTASMTVDETTGQFGRLVILISLSLHSTFTSEKDLFLHCLQRQICGCYSSYIVDVGRTGYNVFLFAVLRLGAWENIYV
jgi:hypothetical protein